jgi:single-strand DNA-binding protein
VIKMLNQSVIVGRIVKKPELCETKDGIKLTTITLAVPRSFKNDLGEYETDFLNCKLWNGIAENAVEYLNAGDLVGIKGRLQSVNYEEDNIDKTKIELIVDKVTYLSNKKADE